jgi:hypothetical protein
VGLLFRAIRPGSCRRKSLSEQYYICFSLIQTDKILVLGKIID